MLAFVGGDDNGCVVGGSLDSLFDAAAAAGAAVVAPGIGVIFHSFLPVFAPSVAII